LTIRKPRVVAHPAKHPKCHGRICAFWRHFSKDPRTHIVRDESCWLRALSHRAIVALPRSAGFFPQMTPMNADSMTEN